MSTDRQAPISDYPPTASSDVDTGDNGFFVAAGAIAIGFVLVVGAVFLGSMNLEHAQNTSSAAADSQSTGSAPIINLNDRSSYLSFANGLQIEGARTYWIMETQYGRTLCLPSVSFLLRNTGSAPIESLTFNAQFLDPAAQTVFSEAVAYSFKQPGPLPPRYKRGIVLEADKGFDPASGRCSPERLSAIKFEVTVTISGYRTPIEVARGAMQTSNILAHAENADMEVLAEQAVEQISK